MGRMWRALLLAILVLDPVFCDVSTAGAIGEAGSAIAQSLVETSSEKKTLPKPATIATIPQIAPTVLNPQANIHMSALLQAATTHKLDLTFILLISIGLVLLLISGVMGQSVKKKSSMTRFIFMLMACTGLFLFFLAATDAFNVFAIVGGVVLCLLIAVIFANTGRSNKKSKKSSEKKRSSEEGSSQNDSTEEEEEGNFPSTIGNKRQPADTEAFRRKSSWMGNYLKLMYQSKSYLVTQYYSMDDEKKLCAKITCSTVSSGTSGPGGRKAFDGLFDKVAPESKISGCISVTKPHLAKFETDSSGSEPSTTLLAMLLGYLMLSVDPELTMQVETKLAKQPISTEEILQYVGRHYRTFDQCV